MLILIRIWFHLLCNCHKDAGEKNLQCIYVGLMTFICLFVLLSVESVSLSMIRISNDNLFQVSEQKVQQKYVSSNYIMSLDLYIHISRITLFILLLY